MFTTSISSQSPFFMHHLSFQHFNLQHLHVQHFLSGSWASFCLYLLPSNYQSLFSPDLLDVRKIFKVLVNVFSLNHFHNYLLNFSIEYCKNFSDNLQNTTNARIPNNHVPLPRNRKESKLSFEFLQNSKERLKVIEILKEACTQVNL